VKLDSSAFVADQELLDAIEKRSSSVVCDQDRILFRQGDEPTGLYVLRSGSATLTMASLTGEIILHITVTAGALLGLPGLIGGQPYSLTAKVAKGTQLDYINRNDFSDLMIRNPTLSLKVLSVLAAEVRSARTALTNM
jgi:CRP-like cAMP-binding protein